MASRHLRQPWRISDLLLLVLLRCLRVLERTRRRLVSKPVAPETLPSLEVQGRPRNPGRRCGSKGRRHQGTNPDVRSTNFGQHFSPYPSTALVFSRISVGHRTNATGTRRFLQTATKAATTRDLRRVALANGMHCRGPTDQPTGTTGETDHGQKDRRAERDSRSHTSEGPFFTWYRLLAPPLACRWRARPLGGGW